VSVRWPPGALSLRPKPRQSGAMMKRAAPAPSRASSASSASTRNWKEAPTSIQPWTSTSGGRSGVASAGSPHVITWQRSPRSGTNSERARRRGT